MYNLPVRQTDWQTTSLYLVIAISFDTFKRKFLIRYSIMFSKTFKNVKGIIFVNIGGIFLKFRMINLPIQFWKYNRGKKLPPRDAEEFGLPPNW